MIGMKLKVAIIALVIAPILGTVSGSLLAPKYIPTRSIAKLQVMKHARGRKAPRNLRALHDASKDRNRDLVSRLPKATAATFDCRTLGWVPPIVDQGNCGSCWDFSGCCVCTCSFIKIGVAKNDGSFRLSEQYVLDCVQSGGCGGDDNTTVCNACQQTGLPNASDYGPYQADSNNCQFKSGTKLWKIQNWGFCTPNQQDGVANVQDIKNCMAQYGPIGTGVAAGGDWDNAGGGTTITGNSSDINHDVAIVGWDDNHNNGDGSSGAWIMRNSWGTSWADNGYAWVKYGADSIGSEALWVSAGPTPPPGPGPGPTPTPGGSVSITTTGDLPAGTYSVTPGTSGGETVPTGTIAAIDALYNAIHQKKVKK
jgi:C1A family cysteine protease